MARMSRAVRPPWTEMRRNTDDRETVYVSRGRPPQRRARVDVDAGVLVARQRVVVLVGRARGEAEVRGGRGVEGEAPVPGRPGRVVEEEQEAVRHDDQRLVAGVEHNGALVIVHAPPDQASAGRDTSHSAAAGLNLP